MANRFKWQINVETLAPRGINPSQLPSELARIWPLDLFPIMLETRSRRDPDDGFLKKGILTIEVDRQLNDDEVLKGLDLLRRLVPATQSVAPTRNDIMYGIYSERVVGKLIWVWDMNMHLFYAGGGDWKSQDNRVQIQIDQRFFTDTPPGEIKQD